MAKEEIEYGDRVKYIGSDKQVVGNQFVVLGRSSRTDHLTGEKYYLLNLISVTNYINENDLPLIDVPDYNVKLREKDAINNSLKIK